MRDTIRRYLEAEFRAPVRLSETESGALKAVVEAGEAVYSALFSREFVEEHSTEYVEALLRQWNIAAEMRRMEGLELSVSSAGVRLDSSN